MKEKTPETPVQAVMRLDHDLALLAARLDVLEDALAEAVAALRAAIVALGDESAAARVERTRGFLPKLVPQDGR